MKNNMNYFSALKFLSKYIIKYKKSFLLFYVGWLFTALLKVFIPITFAIMIDEIIYYRNLDVFLKVSLVFILMLLFSCMLYFFSETQHCYLSIMYEFDIKKDIFEHFLVLDGECLSGIKSGDIINTVNQYSRECMHFVIKNVIHIINNCLQLILLIVYLFILGWQLGILMLLVVPLSAFVSMKFGIKIKKYAGDQRINEANYHSWLFEILSGLRDIRMLGAKKTADKTFVNFQQNIININIKNSFLTQTATNFIDLINLLARLSIYGVAAYLAYRNDMTVGTLTIVLAYFTNMTSCIRRLSGMHLDAQNRISYIQRIYDFMQTPTESKWTGKNNIDIKAGKVDFCNIDFHYKDSKNIINNLSLCIESEDVIAIVGKSGAGKTTLAYMLIGFYTPQSGVIKIDDQDLRECSLKSIRNNIGIVQQEALIFEGTIRDNLYLGNRNATETELNVACDRAGIADFIKELPNGLDTIIGKNGINLSGGQKQRIAIARIYLKDPKIIIFDEATSALDKETEESIHEAWKDALIGRTTIVIAHRLSSVLLCDKVAIIDNGMIIETGKTDEIIKNSEAFKTLFAIREEEKYA